MRLFVLALVLVAAVAVFAETDDDSDWTEFKITFGKFFLSKGKEAKRRAAFRKNKARIVKLQAAAEAGKISYEPRMYAFHDLEHEEMKAALTGMVVDENLSDIPVEKPKIRAALPTSFDSRKQGIIGAPRNQGKCGSCWTFSSMSSIEAGYAIQTGKQIDLAEQQLVNCGKIGDPSGDTNGCEGGFMPAAFKYLQNNGGATDEASYPYTGTFDNCVKNKPARVLVTGYKRISGGEDAIKTAIMQYGSLAIGVDADEWFTYGTGVFHCKKLGDPNHAVNVIGWDKDSWIVRNSWGPDWGENGTIRLAKTPDGTYYTDFTFAVSVKPAK